LSTPALQRFFNGVLVFLVIWPFAHYALVHTAGLNPWKFGGLAMYLTPSVTSVEFWDESDGVATELLPTGFPPHIQRRVDDFSVARSALGSLHSPSHIAGVLFDHDPELVKLRVRIGVVRLNASTSMLEKKFVAYRFTRSPKAGAQPQE